MDNNISAISQELVSKADTFDGMTLGQHIRIILDHLKKQEEKISSLNVQNKKLSSELSELRNFKKYYSDVLYAINTFLPMNSDLGIKVCLDMLRNRGTSFNDLTFEAMGGMVSHDAIEQRVMLQSTFHGQLFL